MSNLNKLKQGLRAYICLNGYTWSSFAKKHSIDKVVFKCLHPEAKTNISVLVQERIINEILDKEGLTLKDLDDCIDKLAELEAMAEMLKTKEKSLLKSRDPERIKPFLEELEILWSMYPDLRFGQLVGSLSNKIDGDSFYAEDDIWLDKIREKINE